MEHYFINKEHKESDYFCFDEKINGLTYTFKSCDDIFSKDNVDYGTKVLIETVIKNIDLNGEVLDMGSGYGVIGIVLGNTFNSTKITMCDINETAVELSKENVIKNHIKNVGEILVSNAYEKFENKKFDYIITNPPIRAGKENLLNILIGAYEHLNEKGKLVFVIKKKHGEDSIRKKLLEVFESVEILKRDSGYYILSCQK